MSVNINWDFPKPHILPQKVEAKHIDVVGHVNNVVYLRWLEKVAWNHSEQLGLDWSDYERERRAMVARRHELDYLAAAFEGDDLLLATWIIENDKKVSLTRAYQIIRESDGLCLMRARTRWVCMDLDTGKARRMPKAFIEGYKVST
jgi:acyl-CoA thioester hydrolase